MDFEEVKLLSSAYLFQNYGREDICFSRGEREFLYDLQGNQYIDYVAGIAVNALGHNHPALVKAISEQAQKMIHVSNLYYVQEQADLGEAIASTVPSPLGVSMFVNSGAEANEAALKLASKATGRKHFVACQELVPWPHGGSALGHWPGEIPDRFRTVAVTGVLIRAFQRPGGAEGGGHQGDGRGHAGTHPGGGRC